MQDNLVVSEAGADVVLYRRAARGHARFHHRPRVRVALQPAIALGLVVEAVVVNAVRLGVAQCLCDDCRAR